VCTCLASPTGGGLGEYFQFCSKVNSYIYTSGADPGCLSQIPDPDFYPSRISDPGSKNSNERGEKKKFL
jgi:hypothetical protein